MSSEESVGLCDSDINRKVNKLRMQKGSENMEVMDYGIDQRREVIEILK